VFRLLLELGLGGVIVYWFVWFHDAWRVLGPFVVSFSCVFIIGVPFYRILGKSRLFAKMYSKHPPMRMAFLKIGIEMALFGVAALAAWLLQPSIIRFLDALSLGSAPLKKLATSSEYPQAPTITTNLTASPRRAP